jgi:hypothetical protein
VQIAGLKNPVYQYQAFGIYWQMLRGREIGGGFLADEMGLGKTLSFLAYIVVERQLAWLWADVERARRDGDRRHFHLDQQDDEHGVCPSIRSRRGGWIACPCVAGSITATMKAKPGVRLAVVPPGLVLQWREQWNEHVDVGEDKLQMRLAVAHPPAFTTDGRLDIVDARHAKNTEELKARPLGRWKTELETGPERSGPDVPKNGSERMLLLTTAQQYKSWATKTFSYEGWKGHQLKNGKIEFTKGKRHGIVVGIAMIDECHEDYIKNKGRAGVLADLEPTSRPILWGYSGTPLPSTPRGLEGVIWALEEHRSRIIGAGTKMMRISSWDHTPFSEMPGLRYAELSSLSDHFEHYVKRNVGYKGVMPDFETRLLPFLRMYMLRRTTDTLWFGRPLIKLNPHYHQDIFLKEGSVLVHSNLSAIEKNYQRITDREKEARLAEVQENWDAKDELTKVRESRPVRLSFNAICQAEWKHRIFATFPYLILFFEGPMKSLPQERPKVDFSAKECMQWRSARDERRCPYFRALNKIVEGSPKCCWLYGFIRKLRERRDVDGRESKLVIITVFNVVGLILKMVCYPFRL